MTPRRYIFGIRLLAVCMAVVCGGAGTLPRAQAVRKHPALPADSVHQPVPANTASAPAGTADTFAAVLLVPDSAAMAAVTDSLLRQSELYRRPALFRIDPIRSMWLALVFPGGGQIYNRKYWKLPVIYGGYLGCAYALTWNNQMLKDYSQAYLDIMDSDPNTKSYEKMLPMGYDITGKEERFKEIFKNKKNHFRRFRDMSIFAFAGVYLLSVVDAYVDAELSSFDISEDLSVHVEPVMMETYMAGGRVHQRVPALQFCLNF